MKSNILIEHLANADLSFLKVVKDEVIEEKNRNELKVVKAMVENTNCFHNAKKEIADWSKDIEVLEDYFKAITTDKQPIRLNKCTVINDVSLFIDTHLITVKANNGKATFLPYLHRLQELKQIIYQSSLKI